MPGIKGGRKEGKGEAFLAFQYYKYVLCIPGWKNYVIEKIESWSAFTLDWLEFDGPMLIIRYEDFLSDLKGELARLLDFLKVNVTSANLDCVDHHRNGWQKRPQAYLPFDPYSLPWANSSLRQAVERKRKQVYQAVNNFLVKHHQLHSGAEILSPSYSIKYASDKPAK